MDPEQYIKDLIAKLLAATEEVKSLRASIATKDGATADAVKGVTTRLAELEPQIKAWQAEKQQAEVALLTKQLDERMERLEEGIAASSGWNARTERKHEYAVSGSGHGPEPDEPMPVTLWKARKHFDLDAMKKINAMYTKALSEAGNPTGGYLVPPQYYQELVELRRASAPIRRYITVIGGIRTNLLYIPQQTGVSSVGWVADNAVKPSTDEVFGQIAVNIFTLAGIAKVSNQLLEDSNPAVDQLVRNDLGRGLGIEEDRAVLNGSGTGQPTGILNTSGVTVTAASAQTAVSIFDDILSAIGRVQQVYYGQPDCIVMSPRTFAKMQTAKDTTSRYLTMGVDMAAQNLPTVGIPSPTGTQGGVVFNFAGIPIVLDPNMPTTLIDGTRSSVVVGALKEAYLFERDGVTMDVSSEAGTSFEQNQTWFRGEERVGFTAARLPSAFQVISNIGP
jgi:HK97 family phage major capsid protein